MKLRMTRSFVLRLLEEIETEPHLDAGRVELKAQLETELKRLSRSITANPQLQFDLPSMSAEALWSVITKVLPAWTELQHRLWKDPAERARRLGTVRQAHRVLVELRQPTPVPAG